MPNSIERAISAIEAQQKGLDEFEPAYQVGEQLKDICRADPASAELIEKDLAVEKMSIKAAEEKIAQFASQHKKGGCGCCPPREADRILREFYGLAAAGGAPAAPAPRRVIDLSEML